MNKPSRSEIEQAVASHKPADVAPPPPGFSGNKESPADQGRAAKVLGGDIGGIRKKPRRQVGFIWWFTTALILLIGIVLLIPAPESDEQPNVANGPPAVEADPIYRDSRVDEPAAEEEASAAAISNPEDVQRANEFRENERQTQAIAALSEKAKANIRKGEYTQPKGNNALLHYQQMLELDQNNSEAENGIAYITNRFFVLGSKQVEKGQLENARESLSNLFLVNKDSEQYGELANKIADLEVSLQVSPEEKKIMSLLEKAAAAIQKQRFTTPAGDNALTYYQQVLALDQNNAAAKQGMETIAGRYALQANEALQKNDIKLAEELVASMSAINPEHPGLDLLINRIKKIQDAEIALQRDINQSTSNVGTEVVPETVQPVTNNNTNVVQQQQQPPVETINTGNELPQLPPSDIRIIQQPPTVAQTQPTPPTVTQPDPIPAPEPRQPSAAEVASKQKLDNGLAAYYAGDYDSAMTNLLPLAERGIARAQVRVGYMYYLGRGVEQNRQLAEQYLSKAMPAINAFAEDNRAWAQADLGSLFEDGIILKQNYDQAVSWYRKAAEQNYPGAQTNLGNMFYLGKGVDQDSEQAIEWYRRAAANGDAVAKRNLKSLGIEVN